MKRTTFRQNFQLHLHALGMDKNMAEPLVRRRGQTKTAITEVSKLDRFLPSPQKELSLQGLAKTAQRDLDSLSVGSS